MPKHSKKLKSLLKYLTAAVVLVVPLYQKFPLFPVSGTFVSVRLEDFLILVTLIVWFLYSFPDLKNIIKNKIVRAIVLFLAVTLVSTLAGAFLTHTVDFKIGILHWARRIEYLSMFLVGMTVVKTKKDLRFFTNLIFVVIFFVFIYGVGQRFLSFPAITTQNNEYSKGVALRYLPGGHLNSTFAGHYDLATYLVLVAPVFFGLLFSPKTDKKYKAFLIGIILACYWLLVNTLSRISIVSFMGGIVLALLLLKKYKAIVIAVFSLVIFTAFSTNLLARYMSIIDVTVKDVREKIMYQIKFPTAYAQSEDPEATEEPAPQIIEDRSTSIRLNVEWPRAARAVLKNPLLGTGFSSITLATDNDYLRLMGEAGFVGFAAFSLVITRIIKDLSKIIWLKRRGLEKIFAVGIGAGFLAIMLNAVFIDIFEASKFATSLWLFLGMAVSSVNIKLYDQKN